MKRAMWVGLMAGWLGAGCGGGGKEAEKPAAEAAGGAAGNPITAPVDYLGAVGKAQRSAEATADVASLQRAIQMFQVEEGRNPKTLEELVEGGQMPRLPQAPYGMRIDYDPVSGRVAVVRVAAPRQGGAGSAQAR